MLEARTARKTKVKLRKLRDRKDDSTSKLQKLEQALASLEESFARKQQPTQKTTTTWFIPALPRPSSWIKEEQEPSNCTTDFINSITEDQNWGRAKKREYNKLFKENDPEGWEKNLLEHLEHQKQALE